MIVSNQPVRDNEIARVVERAKLNDLDGKAATHLVKWAEYCWVLNEWSGSAEATTGWLNEDDLNAGTEQGNCRRNPIITSNFSTSL